MRLKSLNKEQALEKGTRVRTKTVDSEWDNLEGEVTSSHTNGMIYVKLDGTANTGVWSFAETELERIAA